MVKQIFVLFELIYLHVVEFLYIDLVYIQIDVQPVQRTEMDQSLIQILHR